MDLVEKIDAVIQMDSFRVQNPLERMLSGPFWTDTTEGRELLQALDSPTFDLFDEQLILLGNSSRSVNRSDLANWCLDRALVVGSQQTVTEINEYINADNLEVYEVLLLSSVHIDCEYTFCNGVELKHISSIPNKYLANSFARAEYSSPLPWPTVHSVLIQKFEQQKFHWSNTDSDTKSPRPERPIEILQDTRRALALARPIGYGIHALACGTVAPSYYPMMQNVSGWSVFSLKSPPLSPSVLGIELRAADQIVEKMSSLKPDLHSKLKISIDKLNGYSSGADVVESAIDLRICLESIFLNDGNKDQLRHTLALRAARFLGEGEGISERSRILKVIKNAYDLTSTMVHSGERPNKDLRPLDEAAQLAKMAILKILDQNEINWQEVELGNA